jgi:biopolymer transport protein ExbB
MSLLDIVFKGGWVMFPIALISIAVIAIAVSRYLTLSRERKALSLFVREWENRPVDPRGYQSASRLGPQVAAAMLSLYEIERMGSRVRMSELETIARRELEKLESGLGAMATFAAVGPLLGFLGTVTGMVRAFMQIQNLGGAVNASVLAGGIWEALITTVAGLIVGIPALIIHNWLASMVKDCAGLMEQCSAITIRQFGAIDEA